VLYFIFYFLSFLRKVRILVSLRCMGGGYQEVGKGFISGLGGVLVVPCLFDVCKVYTVI